MQDKNSFIEQLYNDYKGYVITLSADAVKRYPTAIRQEFPIDTISELSSEFWAHVPVAFRSSPYDPSKASVKTWLVAIFRGVLRNIFRKHSQQKRQGFTVELKDEHMGATSNTITDWVDVFRDKRCMVLKWLYLEGFSREDICRKFNISQRRLAEIEKAASAAAREILNNSKEGDTK